MFMANNQVKVGLVGFGTVGSGVVKLLLEDADAIEAKTGLRIELAAVVDIDTTSPRPVKLPRGILTDDLSKLLNDDSIQIGVELVGGTGVAKDIQLKLLQVGKNVVTANKALLADCGSELYAAAALRRRPRHQLLYRLRGQLRRRDTHRLSHPNRSCRQPHRRHLRYPQRNLQLYPLQHDRQERGFPHSPGSGPGQRLCGNRPNS
jgi:hypothetical protein